MRHAKAEPFASTDHERALTDRGRREAVEAGRYLSERGVVPDHVVVSSAKRTMGTWAAMTEALESTPTVVADDAVYAGSVDVVLETLRLVPEDARVVVFVGHQPAIGYLAHLLDDGAGDHEALHQMLHGFATASMAFFDVEVAWADLAEESGRLVDFRPGSA